MKHEFRTRPPSCEPSWPMIMLAGVEGSGKTWAAAEATGMPIIGRSFFIEVGESMADEYGAVPGAQFEIIEHDGTFRQILGAAQWAASIKPNEGYGKYAHRRLDQQSVGTFIGHGPVPS